VRNGGAVLVCPKLDLSRLIALVAELTASFALTPTLIVTCIVASITAQLLGSKPIYESLLDRTLAAEKKT